MKNKEKNIYFSIIICCYNSEDFLIETINSIINQTYKFWEIVIVDDGSTDSTNKIIIDFQNKGHSIIYHKNNTNIGFPKSRNKSLELCNYPWIVINDHDDVMIDNKLDIYSKLIVNYPNFNFFFSDAYIYENNQNKTTRFENFEKQYNFKIKNLSLLKNYSNINLIRYGCFIISSTVVFNKQCLDHASQFNDKLKFTCDYDFFLKLSKEYNFFCIQKPLVKWRLHSNQATNRYKKIHYKELSSILFTQGFMLKNNYFIKLYAILKSLYFFIKFFIVK